MRTRTLNRGLQAAAVVWLLVHSGSALAAEIVEVTLQFTVPEVAPVTARLREVMAAQPHVEQVNFLEQSATSATLRLPVDEVSAFLEAASAVGHVTRREVNRNDVTAQLRQCVERQREVRVELERLERSKPNDADEAIRLADAVRQRRADGEMLDEECRVTKEASERATVFVSVNPLVPPSARPAEPHFFPGVRGAYLFDAGSSGAVGLLGLGLSAGFGEYVTFEVDLYRALGSSSAFLDGMVMSAGFDIGSALFGNRKFFSPHLGIRAGISALTGRVDFASAATAGVTLVQLQYFQLDAQVRLWGFFGNRAGAHLGVQSGLVVAFGF